jgi:hypothetical protein
MQNWTIQNYGGEKFLGGWRKFMEIKFLGRNEEYSLIWMGIE